MQFVVNHALLLPSDADATPPEALVLNKEPALPPTATRTRQVSLNEEVSGDLDPAKKVCVCADELGAFAVPINQVACTADPATACPTGFQHIETFGPTAAKLGVLNLADPADPLGIALPWEDTSGVSNPVQVTMADNVTKKTVNVTENPRILGGVAPVEEWEIYNFTEDAHPIHLHLVEFQVVGRTPIPPGVSLVSGGVQPWESGFKDTVVAYPGEITTVRAKFDIPGLYVWHCHIVEHEDNEMMRPYVVSIGPKRGQPDFDGDSTTDIAVYRPTSGVWFILHSSNGYDQGLYKAYKWGDPTDIPVSGDYDGDGKTDIAVWRPGDGVWYVLQSSDGYSQGLYKAYKWGDPTDIPVPGDYDGRREGGDRGVASLERGLVHPGVNHRV